MLAGELYRASDPELQADAAAAKAWMVRYNGSLAAPAAEQRALLAERLAHVGADAVIRPPFFCDYGYNIRIGDGAFLNFNCVILDVVEVVIGVGTQIGPLVQILTADHPRDPELRRTGLEFGRPVRIGENVWIGGGAMILPGVTVGDDAVLGQAAGDAGRASWRYGGRQSRQGALVPQGRAGARRLWSTARAGVLHSSPLNGLTER